MQLCLGQYNTSIDVKAAEGKLAGPMIKNGLTTAVSKHKSDQDCYIPCSKVPCSYSDCNSIGCTMDKVTNTATSG